MTSVYIPICMILHVILWITCKLIISKGNLSALKRSPFPFVPFSGL